ncbi:monovalent cation/H+ antiporter subunit A [Alishewanella tabrizica]|uniref:Monovalent cation/H+ antiporter subunit A n=1 Tax=Alishewanella tabrizica TaxID=671278 RepID=A0ABQ2WRB4_9ALTE|nr:monovalent cation/H+ antiporter subunit A [Alishewanella tabrizica]GGW67700.1 monovalent cation/H+ antiporter subunit A [Alishewanella tabrizica]
MLLLLLILLPFIGAIAAACMPAHARNREAWFAAAIALSGLLITLSQFAVVSEGSILRYEIAWLPAYDLNLIFRMDGLAWLFTVLIQGICLLVVLYARYYMSPKDPVPRFFAFLLAFMGAMQGVVLSGNLIQLVMFWELTSLTSFLLIGYWHHRPDARRGARMAFTVTSIGGLCLLIGVLLLGHIAGSYDLDKVLLAGEVIRTHAWYLPTLILIALGALTKSAQFPFHFWLPHAMAAPTPVSAYLHSATMVKAGIFLLMRLWPVLAGTPEWTWIIGTAGVCTMLIGAFLAIFQHDLKGLLAYSTISHLGLITCLLGIGTPLAMVAAIFHTLNHATFKASLFMAVGIIDHETGSRDMRTLSGLRRVLPYTATLAIVASAAMAGVPLLNGFLSKEMFFAEALLVGSASNWWMSAAAVLMAIFGVAYSLRFIQVFFGPLQSGDNSTPHEPPRWMRFPVELLVLCCLIVGILPELSIGLLLGAAAQSVLGDAIPEYSLAIWHGVNLPLVMSVLAFGGGVVFYRWLVARCNLKLRDNVPLLHRLNGKEAYETTMLLLAAGAARLERWLGTRRLQPQLVILILLGISAALLMLWYLPTTLSALQFTPINLPFALLWLVGCSCAIAAAWQAKYHRLAALILVGGTGIVTSLTFLWLSAPDVALTQLMVETVTTILLLLGLRWLPARISARKLNLVATSRDKLRRIRDLSLAITAGVVLTLVSYIILIQPENQTISLFFLEKSLPEGGGSNVVNVLLVDFRNLDTLGEITVLSIVALTVYALLRRFRPAPESMRIPPQQTNPVDPASSQLPGEQAATGYLQVPAVYLRLLLPIIIVVAIYFFMRGHNLPGGGFIAGLIFAVALIIQYMLAGTAWVEARLKLQPHRWISIGLGLATLSGMGAWLFGYPFLTTHTAHVTLPLLGELHLPSAFVFDLGVFAVVVGTTMLILIALAHQAVRSHRIPGQSNEYRAQQEQK